MMEKLLSEPGRYLVRLENQYFLKSPQTGTTGFCLPFRILKSLSKPDAQVKTFVRELTLWLTEDNRKRFMRDLHALGYKGTTVTGVSPRRPGFHNFRGHEVELECSHKIDEKGGTVERWSLPIGADKQSMDDETILDHFDQLLAEDGGKRMAVNESGSR